MRDPVVSLSASDRIVEALKREVITGALQPGSVIIEAQVGARFGVSKTPAREALLRLAEIGLVEVMAGRGYVVTKLSWQQIKDLFELRLHFELTAVELATQRAVATDVIELKRIAVRPRQKALSVEALIDYNLEFHRKIWQTSRNERLVKVLLDVMEDLMRSMHEAMMSEDTAFMVDQHVKLATLIGKKDVAGAKALMELHVDQTRRRLLG